MISMTRISIASIPKQIMVCFSNTCEYMYLCLKILKNFEFVAPIESAFIAWYFLVIRPIENLHWWFITFGLLLPWSVVLCRFLDGFIYFTSLKLSICLIWYISSCLTMFFIRNLYGEHSFIGRWDVQIGCFFFKNTKALFNISIFYY